MYIHHGGQPPSESLMLQLLLLLVLVHRRTDPSPCFPFPIPTLGPIRGLSYIPAAPPTHRPVSRAS